MRNKEQILVVDDAPETLEVIERNLSLAGYRVMTAPGAVEAVRVLEAARIDLVITDLRMPRANGMELIRHVRENHPDTEIIMVTGYATIPGAVEAMQAGAHAYLAKPFTDEELLSAVKQAIDRLHVRRPGQLPKERLAPVEWGLIGESQSMQAVYRLIAKAAQSAATVLISGESGTGKELVARAIHYQSARRTAPFVPVNCGAVPDGLLESELFGHCKGSFTGAGESRPGFFQAAEGGSIFLDEIVEFSLPMQVALLRVLQDKTVFMVGSRQPRRVDVRVLAATNTRLEEQVERGQFREDLYYRIHVIPVELPPLRDREDDVILLAHHFAQRFAGEMRKASPTFTDQALSALRSYSWPGNVRELENVVQRLILMTERDVIDAADLPSLMRFTVRDDRAAVHRTLAEEEAAHIQQVLASVGGNKSRAAEILGIDRKTLRRKLQPSKTTTAP
jgi:two-component system, NtrC family, response regulator HydG